MEYSVVRLCLAVLICSRYEWPSITETELYMKENPAASLLLLILPVARSCGMGEPDHFITLGVSFP